MIRFVSDTFKVTEDQAWIFSSLTSNVPLTYQGLSVHLLDAAYVAD